MQKLENLLPNYEKKRIDSKNIADALGISNKTVSKWETGLGCPDLSLWPDLSVILGTEITQLMEGEITTNKPDVGNISNIRFYVCPNCGNILVSIGKRFNILLRKKLERLEVNSEENIEMQCEEIDMDYYITLNHEMNKEHYISFAAYVKSDRIYLNRLYPNKVRLSEFLLCEEESFMFTV